MENQNKCIACKHWNLQGTGYCSAVQLCWGYNAYEKKESEEMKTAEPKRYKWTKYGLEPDKQGEFVLYEEINQFASQSLPEIEDKEIIRQGEIMGQRQDSVCEVWVNTDYFKGWTDAIKWYRGELKRRSK